MVARQAHNLKVGGSNPSPATNLVFVIKNKNIQQLTFLNNLLLFFFCTYPICFLVGNFFINLYLQLINLILVYGIFKNFYTYKILNRQIIYLLLFLFFSFLVNLIFSNNMSMSFLRIFKFLLIIGSIIAFRTLITNLETSKINKIYKIWFIIFLVVVLDVIFELIFGFNVLGFKSFMSGRIASFTGDNLNIGHYFSAFSLFFLSYIYLNYKNNSLNLILAIFLVAISFLIGERSNFIRTISIILLFIVFINEIKIKFKILSFSSLIILFLLILNFNPDYKLRYVDQFTKVLTYKGVNYYLNNTVYGSHYNVAKEIFKDNMFFGAGIKNFRIESSSKKYENLDHPYNDIRANTHPHQIHYEFLSETGLFGYISFVIFIFSSFYLTLKNYVKNKNLYQFSAFLYVLISLLPLLPSGSFFSTYTSSLFWLNYAVMVSYINNKIRL